MSKKNTRHMSADKPTEINEAEVNVSGGALPMPDISNLNAITVNYGRDFTVFCKQPDGSWSAKDFGELSLNPPITCTLTNEYMEATLKHQWSDIEGWHAISKDGRTSSAGELYQKYRKLFSSNK